MEQTKSPFASKTIWTGIVMILFNVLSATGVLPEGLTEEVVTNAVNAALALLAIIFRWTAVTSVASKTPE